MTAREAATPIRLMAFDVDGVMTDGTLFFTTNGETVKAFSSQDGHGLKMLHNAGIEVAIISGRSSRALAMRAANLGIGELHMGIDDKRSCLAGLLAARGLSANEAGYMGDDVVDLPILRYCGFSATPADGHDFVKAHVAYVARKPGGHGAVREVCDYLLAAQGKLDGMLAAYLL